MLIQLALIYFAVSKASAVSHFRRSKTNADVKIQPAQGHTDYYGIQYAIAGACRSYCGAEKLKQLFDLPSSSKVGLDDLLGYFKPERFFEATFPKELHDMNPDMKIILVFRDPVYR